MNEEFTGPVSAVTPGQAQYEARRAAKGRRLGATADTPDHEIVRVTGHPWEDLPPGQQADEEAGAQAAIAAQPSRDAYAVRRSVLTLAASYARASENDEIEGHTPGSLYTALRAEVLHGVAAELRKVLDVAAQQPQPAQHTPKGDG